jgi:hypothetical protein
MRRFYWVIVFLGFIFLFVSCSSKGKKTDDVPDDENDNDVEIIDDDDSSGIVVEEDDVPDENEDDVPDENDIPVNPCDPNPCNEPNRSICEEDGLGGFICNCDEFTCEIEGNCYADGEISPFDMCSHCDRTFSKTSWTVRPDGSYCEASAGIPGSGICRKGVCGGFGNCDTRAYGQGAGYPCNYDSECATGRCYYLFDWAGGMSVVNVCTSICSTDEECPGDMLCQYSNEFGYECLPRYTSTIIKPEPLMDDYKPCNVNEDCSGGLCLAYGSKRFCTKNCERSSGGGKDLLACGLCGECKDNGDELGFKFKYYCVPDGSGKTGNNCESGMDCSSGACYDNYCTSGCGSIVSPCPAGYQCMEDVYSEGVKTCVDTARIDIPNGFSCSFDYQCTSGECLEFPIGKYCSELCEDGICSAGDCVKIGEIDNENDLMACAPIFMPGHSEYGQVCSFDWECENDLECQKDIKMCTKPCEDHADCPNGVCYPYLEDLKLCVPDYQYGTKPDGYYCYYGYECENECFVDYSINKAYCSSECQSDSDCPDISGCHDGFCHHAYPWRSFTYEMCRFNDDCEKYTDCEQGLCTIGCSSDNDCDGFQAVVPNENQKTCKPCTANIDCQNVFYDSGQCVTGHDGTRFCVEDCTDDPSLCPEGTRCYSLGSSKICYPLSGFCSDSNVSCNMDDLCIRPSLENNWACREDGECKSRICKEGTCQAGICSENSDCDCDMLECKSGNCAPKSSAGTLEIEPNNEISLANTISKSGYSVAYFNHIGNLRDTDIFKVSIKKDEVLNVRTHPFCDHNADTYLRFLDSSGNLIGEWENDDIDPSGYFFSELLEYIGDSSHDVFIEVTQSQLTPQPQNTPYLLEVQIFTPESNNSCENPEVLTPGTYNRSIKKSTNTMTTGSCSGGYGYGPDLFYKVNVPAGNVLNFKVIPDSEYFNPELSIISGCGLLSETCLSGNSVGPWGKPEEISYFNNSDISQDYIVALDTPMMPFSYDFTIELNVFAAETPDNDKIEGAVELTGSGTVSGTTVGAVNDYSPDGEICEDAKLDGPDVVYSINLKAGDFFHTKLTAGFAAVMYAVKADDLNSCIGGGGIINYETDTDELIYLFVDSSSESVYGTFIIDYIISETGPCNGLCPDSDHRECSDEINLCMCDSSTGLLKPTDCSGFCINENDALTGGCFSNDEGNGCVCNFDCSDTSKVEELCSDGIYSNCTCAASDPCNRVEDDYCDPFCADFFPDDHFDDSADCS